MPEATELGVQFDKDDLGPVNDPYSLLREEKQERALLRLKLISKKMEGKIAQPYLVLS